MRLKLRELRERQFLTQQELADKVGTTKANISRMETGTQRPRPSTIRRLAEALGVTPDELVEWGAGAKEEGAGEGKAAA